jgi:hypothetical protein
MSGPILSGADFRANRSRILDIFRENGLTEGSIVLYSPPTPTEAYSGSDIESSFGFQAGANQVRAYPSTFQTVPRLFMLPSMIPISNS